MSGNAKGSTQVAQRHACVKAADLEIAVNDSLLASLLAAEIGETHQQLMSELGDQLQRQAREASVLEEGDGNKA